MKKRIENILYANAVRLWNSFAFKNMFVSAYLSLCERQPALGEQTLTRLRAHQLDHHLQSFWAQVHAGRVCEVLVDVLECSGSPKQVWISCLATLKDLKGKY